LLPEREEKQIVKKFHIVVFRCTGFLAVPCSFGKPGKMANLLPADVGKWIFSPRGNGVKIYYCYSGWLSIEMRIVGAETT